jgi:hypothetical protein
MWLMSRVATLNRYLRQYDRELYAEQADAMSQLGETEHGVAPIYVLRRNSRKPHEPHFIFALTEDWTHKTRPREWGIEVVLNRLKAIDLWKNETVVDRLMKEREKHEESERREVSNSIESFLKEFRGQFAKATNHINTSCLDKTDARRKGDLKYVHSK